MEEDRRLPESSVKVEDDETKEEAGGEVLSMNRKETLDYTNMEEEVLGRPRIDGVVMSVMAREHAREEKKALLRDQILSRGRKDSAMGATMPDDDDHSDEETSSLATDEGSEEEVMAAISSVRSESAIGELAKFERTSTFTRSGSMVNMYMRALSTTDLLQQLSSSEPNSPEESKSDKGIYGDLISTVDHSLWQPKPTDSEFLFPTFEEEKNPLKKTQTQWRVFPLLAKALDRELNVNQNEPSWVETVEGRNLEAFRVEREK